MGLLSLLESRRSWVGGILPVIAISVSKQVYDYYHSLRSGERSKRFRNILERHLRLQDTMFHEDKHEFHDYKLENQQLRDNIMKLQARLTEALEPKEKSRHWLIRLFLRDTLKEMQPNNDEQE